MATTFFRILKFGFQNFSRNALLSATTISVLVLALLVFNGLLVFGVAANTATASLQDKIDISVYFKSEAPEDQILELARVMEKLPEVKAIEYVSQDKALSIFKDQHKDDPTIQQALEELQSNPLLASLNIKARNPDQYANIAEYLTTENLSDIIDKVNYTQTRLAIERLARIIDTIRNTGLAVTIFLSLVAILVTFNTIRLVIYSNREEIGIMRLVGAANKFIHGPYVVAGIIYGLLGGVISLLIASPIIILAAPYADVFIPELSLTAYFFDRWPQFLTYNLAFGILLGSISATIAVRRYLKI
ncbi:MAG: ABC transporter permease [Candidatus Harrisonbacteria bacterium]|nr:ABC transporter permease [Candidatus Harrisonbacteria bacterium]